MPISEIERRRAEKVLSEYCARRTNPEVRDQLEIVYRLEGDCACVAERRPDWMNASIVRDHDVAKFRFVMKDRAWTLYWRDRNLAWHRFPDRAPTREIGELLAIVDSDPIFYG